MIKKEQRLDAVHHARKYFTAAEPDQMDDIQKVMALLGQSKSSGYNGGNKTGQLFVSRW